ncbi:MAG: alpha/beta fold hydrolase [Magnetococcales bacterium]|nr:alpha/beta fold hydrolase [Magnetococcales bacterium]
MSQPSLLEHPSILRFLFHPRRETPFDVTNDAVVVRFPVDRDLSLGGRLHIAAPEAPSILFWHGNGEIAADYDEIGPVYTGMGVNLLVVDYRGYGISDGMPAGSALLADAVAVYRQVREVLAALGVRDDRLFVMGRSLGSAAALETASHAQTEIRGLILESGFAQTIPLLEYLGGVSLTGVGEEAGFGNLGKSARIPVPVLIIHGQEDQLILVENAEALFASVPHPNKRLITIPHAGHNDLMMFPKLYFEPIRRFITDHS